MFLRHYDFFGSTVECIILQTAVEFNTETNIYKYIKKASTKAYWKYLRIDTKSKIGFPDVLLLRKDNYWQIEAKMLRKNKLISLQDDLKWQFGQLAYMKNAFSRNLNYMLVVGKNNSIAFLIGGYNAKSVSYPDFVKCL